LICGNMDMRAASLERAIGSQSGTERIVSGILWQRP
jgi:hypothetical protein